MALKCRVSTYYLSLATKDVVDERFTLREKTKTNPKQVRSPQSPW